MSAPAPFNVNTPLDAVALPAGPTAPMSRLLHPDGRLPPPEPEPPPLDCS